MRQTNISSFTSSDPQLYGNIGPLGDLDPNAGNFSIFGLQRGIEVGYTDHAFTGRASWFNGVDETGDGTTPTTGRRAHDYAVQGEYLFGNSGSVVSGYYYAGKTPIMTSGYDNQFHRTGIFASKVVDLQAGEPGIPKLALEFYGGQMWGSDQVDAMGNRGNSVASLLEMDLYSKHQNALMARYDTARGSDIPGSSLNQITTAYTAGIASMVNPNLRASLEYRKQSGPDDSSTIGSVTVFY